LDKNERESVDLQPAVRRVRHQIARASEVMLARTRQIAALECRVKAGDETLELSRGESVRQKQAIDELRAKLSASRPETYPAVAADACDAGTDQAHAGQPDGATRPTSPVTFQFEYAATASPASVAENNDTRELALGFRRLTITVSSTGRTVCDIDFTSRGNSGDYLLSGFGQAEWWGTWSVGKKSAVVLWGEFEPLGPLLVELDAKPYAGAFAAMPFTVTSSVGHRHECSMADGDLIVRMEAESRTACASAIPLPVSDGPTADHNVSLAEKTPLVSVIILDFNKPQMSTWSARAVLASSISVPYEVIIVDNGSDPYESARGQETPVRRVRLPLNRYFGEGNNLAAESARGEYLVFLNNDAFPAIGCIDGLLGAFRVNKDCGAAAPVFRYPDGRLQEAGAFVTKDGVALQRGKVDRDFDPSGMPEYDVVDYVSAACMMVRADVFADLGGFNYRYEPAYYEDTDLCLRLNMLGKRAIVVRDAGCMHIENVTTRDLRRHQPAIGGSTDEHNKAIFCSNWRGYLSRRSTASLPHGLIPRSVVRAAPRIDEVTQATFSPYPLGPGGAERYMLAGALALCELGATAFATPYPYSRMRLDNVMYDLGLPTGRLATASVDCLSGRTLERIITTGAEWLPRFVPSARRAFFHCQFPYPDIQPADAHRPAQLEALARCEKVIVGSQFTKRAYEEALRSCGRTAVVEVAAPPAASERLLALPRDNMPFILSIERFSPDKRQDVLIEALRATSKQFRSDWTLILCGSVPNNPIHRAYFKQLRESVDAGINVKFVLAPALGVLDELRSQSSIYAHACGYGVKDSAEHWKCEHFGIGLAEALLAGCAVNAYEIGCGAEIISGVGSGATFGSVEQLAFEWERADMGGVDPEVRQRTAQLYGERVFAERLLAIVS